MSLYEKAKDALRKGLEPQYIAAILGVSERIIIDMKEKLDNEKKKQI